MRILLGIVLLAAGVYCVWEANSILNWGLFQFAALGGSADKITQSDLRALNSFVTDALAALGAGTWGEMQRYLPITRVAGIVAAIVGGLLVFSGLRRS